MQREPASKPHRARIKPCCFSDDNDKHRASAETDRQTDRRTAVGAHLRHFGLEARDGRPPFTHSADAQKSPVSFAVQPVSRWDGHGNAHTRQKQNNSSVERAGENGWGRQFLWTATYTTASLNTFPSYSLHLSSKPTCNQVVGHVCAAYTLPDRFG